MTQLLVSLDDVTPHRGELIQELYFVVLGYDLSGQADKIKLAPEAENLMDSLTPKNQKLKKWFYLTATPVFPVRIRHTQPFMGGLPLYYGQVDKIASIYFSVWDDNRATRQAGEILGKMMKDANSDPLLKALLALSKVANPTAAVIEQAFAVSIKAIELALLNNRDKLRYSTVMTFKERDDFLRGKHQVGNHRVTCGIDVETSI